MGYTHMGIAVATDCHLFPASVKTTRLRENVHALTDCLGRYDGFCCVTGSGGPGHQYPGHSSNRSWEHSTTQGHPS